LQSIIAQTLEPVLQEGDTRTDIHNYNLAYSYDPVGTGRRLLAANASRAANATSQITGVLTFAPSPLPSAAPTSLPTQAPSVPTPLPTPVPSPLPTLLPSAQPTPLPTSQPTLLPSAQPTSLPTAERTPLPSGHPAPLPTSQPTPLPTVQPSWLPSPPPTALPLPRPTPLPTAPPSPAPTTDAQRLLDSNPCPLLASPGASAFASSSLDTFAYCGADNGQCVETREGCTHAQGGPELAFDGDLFTGWNGCCEGYPNQWIALDRGPLAVPGAPPRQALVSYALASMCGECPSEWRLLGGDSPESLEVLDERSGEGCHSGELKPFVLNRAPSSVHRYLYWNISAGEGGNANGMRITEITGGCVTTPAPTGLPTAPPSTPPSPLPTLPPSPVPTTLPTPVPSLQPSSTPSLKPSTAPTPSPTPAPTPVPTTSSHVWTASFQVQAAGERLHNTTAQIDEELKGPGFAQAIAQAFWTATCPAKIDYRSISIYSVTRSPSEVPSPSPSPDPTAAPTPDPSSDPTALPTLVPTHSMPPSQAPTPPPSSEPTGPTQEPSPPPSPGPTFDFGSFSYAPTLEPTAGEAGEGGPKECVCMSEVMVRRISEHCPHVAHLFVEGCMTMTAGELQAVGATCEGLRGQYT